MTKNKSVYIVFFMGIILALTSSCKKQLQVGNPNAPTASANVNSESGLIALAQGGVYLNGLYNGDGWLGNSFFSLPYGYIELMGDVVGAEASNNQVTTIGNPDYFITDDGTKTINPSPQIGIIRTYNIYGGSGNNPLYFQWLNMYALNAACNQVLSISPTIKFGGDATSRMNTIKAWCYWWKGYAYGEIATLYYSGLIQDDPANAINGHYLIKDSILARSNYYYNLCASTLSSISSASDFATVLGELIPAFCQVGNGGILTTDMWTRNINTMLARNILLNKLAPFVNGDPGATIAKSSMPAMTNDDWNTVLQLATAGIKTGDYVFTGRSVDANYFFSAAGGTVAALTTGPAASTTFKISMRYIQDFKPADKRLTTDFNFASSYKSPFYGTPYSITDSLQQSVTGVYVVGTKEVGQYEVFITGSYEENILMLAEANIRLGNIDAGLAYVDQVRTIQGAGVPAVSGTGLTEAQALKELTMERRASLAFRGLTFYDSRRWGWTYDIANGGGSYGNMLYAVNGTIFTNVTINYNFMDYWDIPADETTLNPPSASSAPVKNPNY
jgi:starch-binding outer membrane protein, SusD/RagB family